MENPSQLLGKIENPQLDLALNFVQFTDRNLFLTGKAGTGKTTFLHSLKKVLPKRMIVVAPTGVAAMNAGGVTIHSFFQLPFGPFIPLKNSDDGTEPPRKNVQKFNKEKINIIKSLDLLVIDEISMVRADLLDGIDDVLRRYKNKSKPFGGVQLLMIGDICQLAPVIKEDEWNILKDWYDTIYFFSSKSLRQTQYVSIELKHIYRQSDSYFIDLLNKVRENKIDVGTLNDLNKRYDPEFAANTPEGYIILTTHNHQSQVINERKLAQINDKIFFYKADVVGEFPEYIYPNDFELTLKKGAQVMFVKNDLSAEKRYYNGKIGIIEEINNDDDTIYVKCEGDMDSIPVCGTEWQNIKYSIDEETQEIKENIVGTFTQYPLKLAWAITIHKSQGLTFEKVIIDANAAFAHGQVYVALSRCKTLEGMVLSSKLEFRSIKSDRIVRDFSRNVELNTPSILELERSKHDYQKALVLELFDFELIKRRLKYCLKVYYENKGSLHVGLKDSLEQTLKCVDENLIEISNKFKQQVIQILGIEPDVEKNQKLYERIIKASTYFYEKIESADCKVLQDLVVVCDNKSVRKTMEQAIEKVKTDISIKSACLNKCTHGFSVKDYLEVRAKAVIEKPAQKPLPKMKEEILANSIVHPELFEMLKKWRARKAEDAGYPMFMILQQRSLLEIVERLPETPAELKLVSGIGKQKLKTFGQEIIDIVKAYRTK